MSEITVIIPSRLEAKRLPEKPMLEINNKEMILHVYEAAKQAELGEVYVASPDDKIIQIINQHGGKAVKTNNNHQTGTDRVFEVFDTYLKRKPKIVIKVPKTNLVVGLIKGILVKSSFCFLPCKTPNIMSDTPTRRIISPYSHDITTSIRRLFIVNYFLPAYSPCFCYNIIIKEMIVFYFGIAFGVGRP